MRSGGGPWGDGWCGGGSAWWVAWFEVLIKEVGGDGGDWAVGADGVEGGVKIVEVGVGLRVVVVLGAGVGCVWWGWSGSAWGRPGGRCVGGGCVRGVVEALDVAEAEVVEALCDDVGAWAAAVTSGS